MNDAHLHLILVHIPVVLTPFAVLVLALGIFRRESAVVQVAYLLLISGALAAIPAFLVGEGAEELVENLAGILKDNIEEHEEMAELAIWGSAILGSLSLVGVFAERRGWSFARLLSFCVIVFGVVMTFLLGATAQLGGMIRHPEAFS